MLSLLDPVEFEDTVIFRDDADSRKFYLLPDQPEIPLDDQGHPEFLFIKYIKDDKDDTHPESDQDIGGGLLQFRSVLTMKPEKQQRIVKALKERLEEDKAAGKKPFGNAIDSTDPLLAGPLWTSGKVSLGTFKVSDTGLVRYATDNVPVDLAGDLGSSLSLQLDDTGAEIFWSAFQDQKEKQIPIMVTYQLTYKARVSATMTIHAERKVIHQKILQRAAPYQLDSFARYVPLKTAGAFTMSQLPMLRSQLRTPVFAMVPRPEIQQVIQQSIVNNEVKVTISTDEDAGPAGGGDVRDAMFKLATQVLSDRVVPALFGEDATKPGATTAAQDHANADLVEVHEDTGGQGDLNFDLSFDHQSTIDRQVNPNGPIQLLIDNEQTLASCFKQLRLTDGFFHMMNVSATTTGVNFNTDGIQAVHLFLKYEQSDDSDPLKPMVVRAKDDILKSEADVVHWRFDRARTAQGSPKLEYRYKTQVFYAEGPPSESDWIPSTTEKLVITPHAMGALRVEVVLTALESVVASARVLLQHQAISGNTYKTALELTPKDPRRTWFQYTGELAGDDADLNPPAYSYSVIYRVGGNEITTPWTKANSKMLEIPSPFSKTLTFTLRPQGSFDGVRDLSGDFTYNDSAHGYAFSQSFQLASLTAVQVITVPIFENGPQTAHLAMRLNRVDGTSIDLGVTDAVPGTVFVGRQPMKIDIVTDLVDFDAAIQLAVVQMSYADTVNKVSENKTFTFSKTAKGPQSWIVNRAPGGPDKYDVTVRFIAYDRSKNSELTFRQLNQDVFLLDPSAGP
jgi:hypothetical protein